MWSEAFVTLNAREVLQGADPSDSKPQEGKKFPA